MNRANYNIRKCGTPDEFSPFIKDAEQMRQSQDFKSKEYFLKS